MTKKYWIEVPDVLTEKESAFLTYLYQPILGLKAVTFYRFLFTDSAFCTNQNTCKLPFERIFRFLNFSFAEIINIVEKLKKYKLIEVYFQNTENEKIYIFNLKKPTSVEKFFTSSLNYENLIKIVPFRFLESVYLTLRANNFKINFCQNRKINSPTATSNLHSEIPFSDFAKKWPNSENPLFSWTKEELVAVQKIQKEFFLPNDIMEIFINYTLKKNAGKKIEPNYLLKIVQDLKVRNLLGNKKALITFFAKISQKKPTFQENFNKHLEKSEKQSRLDFLLD